VGEEADGARRQGMAGAEVEGIETDLTTGIAIGREATRRVAVRHRGDEGARQVAGEVRVTTAGVGVRATVDPRQHDEEITLRHEEEVVAAGGGDGVRVTLATGVGAGVRAESEEEGGEDDDRTRGWTGERWILGEQPRSMDGIDSHDMAAIRG